MGFFDKLFDGIVGENKENDGLDFSGYNPEGEESAPAYVARDPRTVTSESTVSAVSAATHVANTSASSSSVRMKVVRPDRFESVGSIANLLMDGDTVLLNLEDTNKETARKLIDFLSGVAYAIGGDLKKIANCTYVITPNFVNVSGEEAAKMQEAEAVETEENI